MADKLEISEHLKTIAQLNEPGEVLANDSPFISVRNTDWFEEVAPDTWKAIGERDLLHRRLVDEELRVSGNAKAERQAIVLAGAPGAGKSSLLRDLLGGHENDYVVIDADKFKKKLMREALEDGTYDSFFKPPEVRKREELGEQFFPMDMASLVHEESSMLSEKLRAACLARGLNAVIDKVLASEESAQKLAAQLQEAGYEIQVVEAYAPQDVSEERIVERWQKQQETSLDGDDYLGARWVPEEFTEMVFDAPGHRSRPAVVAQIFARNCPSVLSYKVFHTAPEAAMDSDGCILRLELRRESVGALLVRVK